MLTSGLDPSLDPRKRGIFTQFDRAGRLAPQPGAQAIETNRRAPCSALSMRTIAWHKVSPRLPGAAPAHTVKHQPDERRSCAPARQPRTSWANSQAQLGSSRTARARPLDGRNVHTCRMALGMDSQA